jgi:queuine tRNA-ribosyltransferase
MTLDCEVVQTRSGTRAVRDRLTGELMHPVGPLIEAQRLYVDASKLARRLEGESGDPLVLWDVGLGAASNASRAWLCSESRCTAQRRLRIISFDRSLAALDLALRLEHSEAFGLGGSVGGAARALLTHGRHQTPQTEWELRLGELSATLPAARQEPADIVFWDPFSPRANSELWTVAAFSAVRRACRAGATLHTYSGATSVRSGLLLAGFAVGLGEAISKGRYATVAATSCEALEKPLDRRWFERLTRSSAAFPLDAPADALERIGALVQFGR